MRMPRWRKMTWVLLVWCAIILIWAIGGASSATKNCTPGYQSACDAGAGIGVAIILFIGFVGFVFFSLIWFMSRPSGRSCPACGIAVKRGLTVCPSCGHDFAAAARPAPVSP